MDSLIHQLENININQHQLNIIINDLKHLVVAYNNEELHSIDFPPLDEEYPYDLLSKHYNKLFLLMRQQFPDIPEIDRIFILNFYIDLVQRTQFY